MAKKGNKIEYLSVTAYAKHRGCTYPAVLKAISEGRISKSVKRDPKSRRKKINPELADAEWHANTNSSDKNTNGLKLVSSAGLPALTVSKARQAAARAKQAEIELAKMEGKLIDSEQVMRKFADVISSAKTKLLGLPTAIKQRLIHLSEDDIDIIDMLVREALEDLANGK